MVQEGDQGGVWAHTTSSCRPPSWDRGHCRKKNYWKPSVWNVGASSFQGFCTKHLGRASSVLWLSSFSEVIKRTAGQHRWPWLCPMPLLPALHHLLPLALTNHMQNSAGKMDHGEETGIKFGVDTEQRQTQFPRSSGRCLGTKWGILMLTEVAGHESVEEETGKHQERFECSPDDPKILCNWLGRVGYGSSNSAQTSCCSTATIHALLGGLTLPAEP